MVDSFIARQPILDGKKRTFAYELLFRSSAENRFPQVDGTFASARVMHDTMHVFGLDTLGPSQRVFINVTRDVLLGDIARLLPPDRVGIEILESVDPDGAVRGACKQLKKNGYLLALDDFVLRPGYEALVELADIVKVDFMTTKSTEARGGIVERFKRPGLSFLAEKVETSAEVEEASRLGYSLFQGYFFAKPEMIAARSVPVFKLAQLRLLAAVNARHFDFSAVEEVVKQDVGLALKLLQYLNSAGFGLKRKVDSIRQALVLLGEHPFRRWVSLLAVVGLGADCAGEVVLTSLARSRFCEQMAAVAGLAASPLQAFLVGLISLADTLIGRPLPELVEQLEIDDVVAQALVHRRGPLAPLLELAVAYERGDWAVVEHRARTLRVGDVLVAGAYHDALVWANEAYCGATGSTP